MRDARPWYLTGVLTVLVGCTPNLIWTEPKDYTPPPTTTLMVDGFGINDSVTILPPGATTITVSHGITNSGSSAVSAAYAASDSVRRWIFRGSPTAGYGWVAGPSATHSVPTAPAPGPVLAAGASATITFPPFVIPAGCGLYGEKLTIDAGGTIAESSETDNVDSKTHLFFVPSIQQFNITIDTLDNQLFHTDGDVATHTFTVTAAGAPGWIYAGFSFVAQEGSRAYTIPAPSIAGGPVPQVITMHVVPTAHHVPSGTVTGKVTVISADGCVLKQQTARVFVEHQ